MALSLPGHGFTVVIDDKVSMFDFVEFIADSTSRVQTGEIADTAVIELLAVCDLAEYGQRPWPEDSIEDEVVSARACGDQSVWRRSRRAAARALSCHHQAARRAEIAEPFLSSTARAEIRPVLLFRPISAEDTHTCCSPAAAPRDLRAERGLRARIEIDLFSRRRSFDPRGRSAIAIEGHPAERSVEHGDRGVDGSSELEDAIHHRARRSCPA
jgi:hypothetical protein